MAIGKRERDEYRGEQDRPAQEAQELVYAAVFAGLGTKRCRHCQDTSQRQSDKRHGSDREQQSRAGQAQQAPAFYFAIGQVQCAEQLYRRRGRALQGGCGKTDAKSKSATAVGCGTPQYLADHVG